MFFITKKHLSRRMLLRGAGTSLALPLLESMIPAGASAAASATPGARLACIYLAHGAIMDQWTPQQEGNQFEFSPTLKSLEPFRDRLNIISDLNLPAANVGPNSAGANHNRSSQCWLTCTAPGTGPSPNSVDQVAAQHIGQETVLPSLELSLEESGVSISYLTPTTPLPMENNPRVVFERLFGVASTPEERASRQRHSASLLDSLTAEVAGLKRNLPVEDRVRMDRYLEDVREIERRLSLAATLPDGVEVPVKPVGVPDDFEDHARLMFDLIVLAWQANLTRVATMLVARELGNRQFPKSGIDEPFHACSHHSEDTEKIALFARMNAYHTRAIIAYFLQKLRDTPDGDGNLLDHSMVLYGSGMSNSNNHDHDPLPILLAGGASGRLAGGRHIRTGRGTPMANLLLSVLEKLEVPVDAFADSNGAVTI